MSVFKNCGIMIDMSRDAVMTLPALKNYIDIIAKLGYDTLYLYMEDMYELMEYPMFGYMRGRYTQQELKEINAYCVQKDLEVVPCIQTLGHMAQYLRYVQARPVRDTTDEMLCGAEETYELINAMLRTMRDCFSTERIHIGMDEALSLGTGQYYTLHGYEDKADIFRKHLNRVCEICRNYNFVPMIWDDVARSLMKTEADIDMGTVLPDVELVPWSYACYTAKPVKDRLDIIKKFKRPITFAATAWTHFNQLPCYNFANATMLSTAKAVAENGVENFMLTIWGDDGNQTNCYFALPQVLELAYFNKHGKFASAEELSRLSEEYGIINYDFCDIAAKFDQPKGVDNYVGKRLMWGDALLNSGRIFDKDYEHIMKTAGNDIQKFIDKNDKWKNYYEYAQLCLKAAALKAHMVTNMREAYLKGNHVFLKDICDKVVPELMEIFTALEEKHCQIWLDTYKPTGFQKVESRYGAQLMRLKYVTRRLKGYLEGEIESLLELELEQLPCTNDGNLKFLREDGNLVYTDMERFMCSDKLIEVSV